MTELAGTGTPAVILGDFNDGKDGSNASHCALTPELSNAFGGSAEPCKKPKQTRRSTTSTARTSHLGRRRGRHQHPGQQDRRPPAGDRHHRGSSAGCAVDSGTARPSTTSARSSRSRPSWSTSSAPCSTSRPSAATARAATDPNGHPPARGRLHGAAQRGGPCAGRPSRRLRQGQCPEARHRLHHLVPADLVGRPRRRGWRPMEDRGSATENHLDHVHINVKPRLGPAGRPRGASCDEVV